MLKLVKKFITISCLNVLLKLEETNKTKIHKLESFICLHKSIVCSKVSSI